MLVLRILDWTLIAASLFNTVALLWLGLTVLLNADRRHWGTWVSGGGMLLGGIAYAGHSAVVGRDIGSLGGEAEFYWRASWLPVVTAPYLWYLGAVWYTGVLDTRRHRVWLAAVTALGLVALALLGLGGTLPSVREVTQRVPGRMLALGGVPLIALIYPGYSVLCIVLALAALHRPGSSHRFMGDLARARARPWFVAASYVLLAVSLIFGLGMGWFLTMAQTRHSTAFFVRALVLFMLGDLLISMLVAVGIMLVGRAVVAYEIFTGKALPRGQLRRDWWRSLALAAGYSVLVGLSLILPVAPIYQLLLSMLLMTVFSALLSWRSYVEHDRSVARLRPFVASQRLYEQLLQPQPPDPAAWDDRVDTAAPFRALCDDLLGARVAYLTPLGPLAPLAGPSLTYAVPGLRPVPTAPDAVALTASLASPQTMCVAIDPARFGGAVWAVPLWSERGLTGALLLGEKRDGGLYTQEEIALARSTGERLIDTRASAEMARRLMNLQRQRLAESQVLDQRTRRTLHDDVLPRLHAALLMLSAHQGENITDAVALLSDTHRQVANLLQAMPTATTYEVTRQGLVGALRQVVSSDLRGAFDRVRWRVAPEAEAAARALPPLAAEVVFGAARESIRNAARYGRNGDQARPLSLSVGVRLRHGLEIVVEDDGVGLDLAGPSHAGSGQGLVLHSTMMAVIGGTLTVESAPGSFTRVTLALPLAHPRDQQHPQV